MTAKPCATVEDLYNVPEHGKAELVNGELVLISPSGVTHGRAGARIVFSLLVHEREHGGGYVVPDNVAFLVNLPKRKSFSPDVAWATVDGNSTAFARGAPEFAVEIRSKGDYSSRANRAIAAKIADYIAAGTLVVWDVDLRGDAVIIAYRVGSPDIPTLFGRGDVADAEPAVPGWRFPVDELWK